MSYSLPNLAGVLPDKVDTTIIGELLKARLQIVPCERAPGEVAYRHMGRLRHVTFERRWRYWVAQGSVALHVAQALYHDPIGREDIRVNGDCTCPEPTDDQARFYLPDGREVLAKDRILHQCLRVVSSWAVLSDGLFNREVEMPAAWGLPFITLYHIDSLAGLRLFADTLAVHLGVRHAP